MALPVVAGTGGAGGDGGDGVPEWVHLLPAGAIRTNDGRGPYTVTSMQAIAAQLGEGGRLPIDECHSIDRAAPLGNPAPARGWIVALQARDDGPTEQQGLWGKVEWTGTGRQLMADKAYRGISPVILHDKANAVLGVLRASLINTPNLQGLVALHDEFGTAEEDLMDWKAKLIEMLGLDASADDAAIETALMAWGEKAKAPAVAPQGALADITQHPTVMALQGELTNVAGKLNALTEATARNAATAFVDAAIAEGRVGIKPLRDDYIALHMADPAQAKKLIGGMLAVKGSSHTFEVPGGGAAEAGLDASDRQVMAMFAISEEDYKAGLKSQGHGKEAL